MLYHRRAASGLVLRACVVMAATLGFAAPSADAQSNVVSTVAGTGVAGFSGDGAAAFSAQLSVPISVAAMPDRGYLIADQGNSRVRLVAPSGSITTVAGSGTNGFGGDGGPATAAQFSGINGLTPTGAGGILLADANNNRIRYVSPAGVVNTVAGTGAAAFGGDNGPAGSAQIRFPADVAVQADGGYLIADTDNHRIRRVAPDGTITTVAGTGTAASGGDGGPAVAAQLDKPSGLAIMPDGGYLIAEQAGNRVRRVAPGGTISTVAGTGVAGSAGDGGSATAAELNGPVGLAVASDGSVLIADRLNHRIRRVGTGGTITTIAGTGTGGYNGDGDLGPATQLNNAFDVSVNPEGDYLIADSSNNRIRLLDASATPAEPPVPGPEPVPEPVIPPPPPAPVERNLTPPQITPVSGLDYDCSEGTWEGLAADPAFTYRWVRYDRGPTGLLQLTTVASTKRYTLSEASKGAKHYCEVYARGVSGRLLSAYSPTLVLTGSRIVPPVVVLNRTYGDFRVRGIDVFQTTQPNSAAPQYGFPSRAFDPLCGGGTPTSFRSDPVTGCTLSGRDAQRTSYAGVSVDRRKRAWAFVYVDMNGEAASNPLQGVDVKLSGLVGGGRLPGALTKTTASLPVTTTQWVTQGERLTRGNYVLFQLPTDWLANAAARGQRLDLEATVQLPLGAGSGALSECPLLVVAGAQGCSADNSFRVDGIPVYDDLQTLTVRALPLTKPGQTAVPGTPGVLLSSPQQVLQRTRDLYPGGEGLNILPYDAALAINPEAITTTSDPACNGAVTVRACRSASVKAAVTTWRGTAGNTQGYGLLLGVHRYDDGRGMGTDEPGWSSGGSIATGVPSIIVNDGSAGRPITAPGHEYGHALGMPHADTGLDPRMPVGTRTPCGGNANGEVGEEWPPDRAGRLQGVAFQTKSLGLGVVRVDARTDTDATVLFDLMSYCPRGNDTLAWLSPRNWNRAMAALRAYKGGGQRVAQRGVRGSQAGQGFVVGTLGPNGGHIERVVPPATGNVVPPPDPSGLVQVRATDASGQVLAESPANVEYLKGVPGAAVFIAAVPPQAAKVEALSGGTVIDSKERSRPPTVRLTAPARPARVGRSLIVRWAAADPDGDALQARVEYSANGRTAWRGVMQGPSTGSATIPGSFLAASERARVRVVINDGFNEASAQSPLLQVDGVPPTAQIISPGDGAELQAGRVQLLGSAVDDANRRLRGRALTWFAGSKRLGTGEGLRTTLPAGRMTLRLVARDSRGRTATASRRLLVTPPMLTLTTLRPPDRVGPRARTVKVRIATSVPATLRAGGRSYKIGPRPRTLSIGLPARPKAGLLRIPLTVKASGARQPAVSETILVLRI